MRSARRVVCWPHPWTGLALALALVAAVSASATAAWAAPVAAPLPAAVQPVQPAEAADDDDTVTDDTIRLSDLPADAPRFEDYPVHEHFRGRPAAPDVRHHPRSRLFRTAIRRGAAEGPDFAGHFTVVGWGCGAGCMAYALVDARTGQVFHPDDWRTVQNLGVDDAAVAAPPEGLYVKYRLDSRLLVVIGAIDESSSRRGVSYFVWQNHRLRRIRFVHRPSALFEP